MAKERRMKLGLKAFSGHLLLNSISAGFAYLLKTSHVLEDLPLGTAWS